MKDDGLEKVIFEGRYLRLLDREGYEFVQRRVARGVVLIVPVTSAGELILVEQYRVPVGGKVLEYPAGLVGDEPGCENETFEQAAHRELLEETGCVAEKVEYLTEGPSSPGSLREVVKFYLARDVHPAEGVTAPEIQGVHRVPLPEAEDWIEAQVRQGYQVDPRVYAGIYFARR